MLRMVWLFSLLCISVVFTFAQAEAARPQAKERKAFQAKRAREHQKIDSAKKFLQNTQSICADSHPSKEGYTSCFKKHLYSLCDDGPEGDELENLQNYIKKELKHDDDLYKQYIEILTEFKTELAERETAFAGIQLSLKTVEQRCDGNSSHVLHSCLNDAIGSLSEDDFRKIDSQIYGYLEKHIYLNSPKSFQYRQYVNNYKKLFQEARESKEQLRVERNKTFFVVVGAIFGTMFALTLLIKFIRILPSIKRSSVNAFFSMKRSITKSLFCALLTLSAVAVFWMSDSYRSRDEISVVIWIFSALSLGFLTYTFARQKRIFTAIITGTLTLAIQPLFRLFRDADNDFWVPVFIATGTLSLVLLLAEWRAEKKQAAPPLPPSPAP